jgi:hypothetical protein
MKCPGTGTMQAYLDGELDIGARKDIETHIRVCEVCGHTFEELKSNDDFAFEKLTYYRSYIADNQNRPARLSTSDSKVSKGVFESMRMYKKYIAAACAALVLVTCITVQPVRAVISDALNIFRVDNFNGLRITPQELAQIKDNLSKGQGDFTLDNIGRIKVVGGQAKMVSQEEMGSMCSFPIMSADGSQNTKPEIQFVEPSTISFTLNAANVNTILKTFKAEELLPDAIDGKTFTANFGAQAKLKYAIDGKVYNIVETISPELQVPEGVDVDGLFNTLVNVPVFPDELKSKLKSITDWKDTLYIPVLEDGNASSSEVSLNGVTAYVSSFEVKKGDDTAVNSSIIWMDNGVIYGVGSNTGKDDLISFAKNLRVN